MRFPSAVRRIVAKLPQCLKLKPARRNGRHLQLRRTHNFPDALPFLLNFAQIGNMSKGGHKITLDNRAGLLHHKVTPETHIK